MDIKVEKKKYLVPRKYWAWIGGGAVLIAVLIWLGLSNFSSTLKVDRKGLSIGTVEKAQFNDYVSVDGQVVPISVVQISSEEGGIVLEKVESPEHLPMVHCHNAHPDHSQQHEEPWRRSIRQPATR